MDSLRKMTAERAVYAVLMLIVLGGSIALSTILHTDSDYAAGLTKPEINQPAEEEEGVPSIEEPDYSYERYVLTFTGSINAGSMLGSSSYGTICGLDAEKGGAYFMESLTDITLRDDMTFSFLSSVFSDNGDMSQLNGDSGWYLAPAENADILSLGGVDAVSLECSGTMGYGKNGYEDTKSSLEKLNIKWGNSGKAIYDEHSSGVKTAVYPCTYKDENIEGILAWIKKAAAERDFVALAVSSEGKTTDELSEAFHSFVDAGADLIVSTNCKSIATTEYYGNGFIAYSLGSLINGADKYSEKYSAILESELIIDAGDLKRVNYSVVPIQNYSDEEFWHPFVADSNE